MPEGPELFLASVFINSVSKSRIYGGQVIKSEVSTKNPDVDWKVDSYRISALTRGKELKVTLHEGKQERKDEKTLDIVFRFGMSGSFKFTQVDALPKHAHLRFFTVDDEPPMVLSFVDYRRFGRWEIKRTWGDDRGPDPMWEYPTFRENVLTNLKLAAFNKPICEAMLNQKFFNGIGNYLRAEILYRCGIRPFDEARGVLNEFKPISKWYEANINAKSVDVITPEPDFLDMCHIVPKEVIHLSGGGKGYNVDPDADEDEYKEFRAWLQCYYQDGMRNLVDHNRRTIWFFGEPGKLVPKETSSRAKVERKKGKKVQTDEYDTESQGKKTGRRATKKKSDEEKKPTTDAKKVKCDNDINSKKKKKDKNMKGLNKQNGKDVKSNTKGKEKKGSRAMKGEEQISPMKLRKRGK